MLLKLDLSKDFDKLSWQYMRVVLTLSVSARTGYPG
jgi:hypothetical protein